ncbi:MAG: sensor histidine kinase [Planctomycetaceae bacterium]|nr:sensor histidine kinase [Planctomycetaceae bacterium]
MQSDTLAAQASSLRALRFRYGTISAEFLQQMVSNIRNHRSVVLLGPRGVGKQFVFSQVEADLSSIEEDVTVPIRICCDDFRPEHAESEIIACLHSRLPQLNGETFGQTFDNAEEFLRDNSVHLCLLVANIDSLPLALTRRLLIRLRRLSTGLNNAIGSCTVLISGSLDLTPLVYGADSEFTPDVQYVIQGFNQELFEEQIRRMLAPISTSVPREVIDRIWQESGGSLQTLHLLVAALLDSQRSSGITSSEVHVSQVEEAIQRLKTSAYSLAEIQLSSFLRLESSPESLSLARQLLEHDECPIPYGVIAPTELELCGLARRDGNVFRWHSPLMQSLAKRYFTLWNLGDAYACCDKWENAIDCYQRASEGQYPWIQSTSRRPRLNAAQRAFETRLHGVAGESDRPVGKLMAFFVDAARFVLGFDRVDRYRLDQKKKKWIRVYDTGVEVRGRDALPTERSLELPDPSIPGCGLIRPPADRNFHQNQFVAFARLRCPERGGDELLVLDCLRSQNPLTRSRQDQIRPVLTALSEAYGRASRNEDVSTRARYQKQLLEALPRIFRLVGQQSPDRTRTALKEAGDALRANGFRRVMFSLVNQAKQEIEGVIDCRDEGEPDIARMTQFTLKDVCNLDSCSDVQQACVVGGKTIPITNAEKHGLTNKDTVRAADLKAMVIVPIKMHEGNSVLGTMHVERNDREPLTSEEIESLEYFGEQLAEAIDVTSMLDMLDGGVQEQSDAVILLDYAGEFCFVNRQAANLLSIPEGWRDEETQTSFPKAAEILPESIRVLIQTATEQDDRISGYIQLSHPEEETFVVSVKPLSDWRKARIGTILQLQNLSSVSELWKNIRDIAASADEESLNETVWRILRVRGHGWGRLYLVNPDNGLLTGRAQFGYLPDSEGTVAFRTGSAALDSIEKSRMSWQCLVDGRPLVFEADDRKRQEVDRTTKTGLRIRRVHDDGCHMSYLKKTNGQLWIDIPLLRQQIPPGNPPERSPGTPCAEWLGKISIDCPLDLSLEGFEQLRILAEAMSGAYAAMAERSRRRREEDESNRQSMERAIGETCHRLQSSITSLETLNKRYELAMPEEVPELNCEWVRRRNEIQHILQKATRRLRAIAPDPARIGLVRELTTILSDSVTGNNSFEVSVGPDLTGPASPTEYRADIDVDLFREAISELVYNSQKATRGQAEPLKIVIQISERSFTPAGAAICRIEYRDNGPGIAESCIDRIFCEFYSHWPNSASPGTAGTGLGMGLVRRIFAAHGGSIHCRPSAEGACFRMEFPRYSVRRNKQEP